MKETKKNKLKKKLNLIYIQNNVLQEKKMKKILGGSGNNIKCVCVAPDPAMRRSTTK